MWVIGQNVLLLEEMNTIFQLTQKAMENALSMHP